MLPVYVVLTLLVLVNVAFRFGPDPARQAEARPGKLPQILPVENSATRAKNQPPQIMPQVDAGQAAVAPISLAGCHADLVFDRDTLELICAGKRLRARLVGFDAPEMHPPRCPAEAVLGARAVDKLRALASGSDVEYSDRGA